MLDHEFLLSFLRKDGKKPLIHRNLLEGGKILFGGLEWLSDLESEFFSLGCQKQKLSFLVGLWLIALQGKCFSLTS